MGNWGWERNTVVTVILISNFPLSRNIVQYLGYVGSKRITETPKSHELFTWLHALSVFLQTRYFRSDQFCRQISFLISVRTLSKLEKSHLSVEFDKKFLPLFSALFLWLDTDNEKTCLNFSPIFRRSSLAESFRKRPVSLIVIRDFWKLLLIDLVI